MENTKIIKRLIQHYIEGSELTQDEHFEVRSLEKKLEAINYTHCCKPPIGLRPKWVSDKERLNEVRSAIVRYYDAEWKIPVEWIEEYNELIDSTKV